MVFMINVVGFDGKQYLKDFINSIFIKLTNCRFQNKIVGSCYFGWKVVRYGLNKLGVEKVIK